MLLSVIIPVYNCEKSLACCLNSILVQSFSQLEIIVVDDGSTDSSLYVAKTFEATDSRVHVITKNKGGVSSARNAGIERASGKYIMFCDADDYVAPDWCELHISAIKQHPTAWIVSGITKVKFDKECKTLPSESNVRLTYFDIYKLGLSPYTVNKIYDATTIKENNILFDENFSLGEDVLFNTSYFKHCTDIVCINSAPYFYIDNDQSATNRYYHDLFNRNRFLFSARLPLINPDNISAFCDLYLFSFLEWLDNTMDKRNPMSFLQKMRYNDKMMKTEEFRYCVAHASGKNDSAIFMHVVRMHNYYIYWLFQKICKLKEKFKRKPKKY